MQMNTMRLYRRVILKHFGSTRSFVLWLVAVVVTIYVIDSYLLTHDRLQSLVNGPKQEVTRMEKALNSGVAVDKAAKQVKREDEKAAKEEKKKKEEVKKEIAKKAVTCGMKEACPANKYAYQVKTGTGRDGMPTICFNGKYAISPDLNNGHRGINVAVINEKKAEIEETRFFDTYADDSALVRYLQLGVKENRVLLLATADEASNSLKEESKKLLHQFGGNLVDKLHFRDGLVMVGQRGLSHGSAIEKLSQRERKEFAPEAELQGCLSIPMGKLNEMVVVESKKEAEKEKAAEDVKLGEELANCGVKGGCGPDSFSVHVFSGIGNTQGPKICIGGKYVLAKGLNDGGRGFNVVIVDPKTKEVVRVGHFDTYAEDSSNLEIFLEMMNDGEIVVATTNDDASKKLSDHGKQLLNRMGSSMIQNMKFRDVWSFVGQKGLKGFTEIEQIEFTIPGTGWPKPIDKHFCASSHRE